MSKNYRLVGHQPIDESISKDRHAQLPEGVGTSDWAS